MIMFLLIGCIKSNLSPLYPAQIPEMPKPPEKIKILKEPDECKSPASYLQSEKAPYIDDYGHPTCRANLVPTSDMLKLLQTVDDAEHWEKVAKLCYDYRDFERSLAEDAYASCRLSNKSLETDLRVNRALAPLLFVAGIALGAGVGVAASEVAH